MTSMYEGEEQYHRIVENISQLPSLPSVATKLMEVVNSPDTSADDAAALVEKDPALTGALLRMANSAFYGIPRSISSVSSAVVVLGFNTIRSIVLSASIIKAFPSNEQVQQFDRQRFWRHSILCGLGAKLLAQRTSRSHMLDPESAFCAGILHDIGKLIFEQYVTEDFSKACHCAIENKISLFEAEKQVMGITHPEIGIILSDKWALPIDLEQGLVHHHNPENAEKAVALVTAVHCADQMAHTAGADVWNSETILPLWDGSYATLKLTKAEYASCCEDLKDHVDKSNEFLMMVNYEE